MQSEIVIGNESGEGKGKGKKRKAVDNMDWPRTWHHLHEGEVHRRAEGVEFTLGPAETQICERSHRINLSIYLSNLSIYLSNLSFIYLIYLSISI